MSKRLLIVGGVSGIGRHVCEKAMSQGHAVTLMDIAQPDFTVERYIPIDLSDHNSIATAVSQLDGKFGGMANIAGLPPSVNDSLKLLLVNFSGIRQITELVLPFLEPDASVVSIASRAGSQWQTNLDQVKRLLATDDTDSVENLVESEKINDVRAYQLSKESIIVWSLQMSARQLPSGIRFNTVSPSAVDTRILGNFMDAFGDAVKHNLDRVGRPGRPDEIAELVVFLLSDKSSWINGIDIITDGGMGAGIVNEQLF